MWDGVDRRKFHRAEYPCLITLRKTMHRPLSLLTHTENISAAGVGIIIRKQVELMTEVDLELDLKDTMPSMRAKGVTRWVKQISSAEKQGSPRYEVGIQFVQLNETQRRRIEKIVEHIKTRER